MSFNSGCLPSTLKGATVSKIEQFDVRTILSLEKNAVDAASAFLNNKNDLVLNLKEINLSCGLTCAPKVLFNLRYLSVLDLSYNSLEGIPNEIGNLCNLIVLKLSGNKLNHLPKSLKHVQQLKYLDISNNKFSEVPDVLYYGVRALRVLDMSYNEITTFNDFPSCLDKLVVLKMSNNLLKEFPVWVFDSLCQLQVLYLNKNPLHLDAEFFIYCSTGIFESLQLLNIENCNVRHEEIHMLSLFKNLSVIQLGNKTCTNENCKGKNYMGNLKSDTFKSCRNLKALYLENTLIASLPSSFDCLKNVQLVDLSGNVLSWLPECFCDLVNLQIINLTSNQLLFLPNNIDKITNLREIHLANNKLHHVPESLSNLKRLEFIDLYNNQIEKFDANILNGKQLKGIDLGLNYLHSDFCECNVDSDEMWELYNSKKDSFRNHFSIAGSRSDLQRTKHDGGCDDKSDSHSCIGSHASGSDIEDVSPNIDLSTDQKGYFEDENWEERDSGQSEEDELFDPNEQIVFERRWSCSFRNNYCPAKAHLPSLVKTFVRKCKSSSRSDTVEDGQFDSD